MLLPPPVAGAGVVVGVDVLVVADDVMVDEVDDTEVVTEAVLPATATMLGSPMFFFSALSSLQQPSSRAQQ